MTVHFVTTGKSLRKHSRCWTDADGYDVGRLDNTPPEELLRDERVKLDSIRNDIFEQLSGDDGANAADVVALRLRGDVWRLDKGHLISAELNTILKMLQPRDGKPPLISSGDEIHLLEGSTNRHECALTKAILEHAAIPQVTVTMSGPYAWDPKSLAGFEGGMTGVWNRISARDREGAALSFVLTGGYKAVLIDIARRIGYERMTASFHYTYEDRAAELITIHVERGQLSRRDYVLGA